MLELATIQENSEHGPNKTVSEQTGLMDDYSGRKDQPDEPKMIAPLTANGSHENGTRNDGSNPVQGQPTAEESSRGKVAAVLGKVAKSVPPMNPSRGIKDTCIKYGILIMLIIGLITAIVLAVRLLQQNALLACPTCPEDWIAWRRKCYHFSDDEGTWNSSQNYCSSHGASLFVPGSEKELALARRMVSNTEHWIGLWREKEDQPWKRPDGSVFNDSLNIGGKGPCAYLDKQTFGSTRCDTERNWICTKSLSVL